MDRCPGYVAQDPDVMGPTEMLGGLSPQGDCSFPFTRKGFLNFCFFKISKGQGQGKLASAGPLNQFPVLSHFALLPSGYLTLNVLIGLEPGEGVADGGMAEFS